MTYQSKSIMFEEVQHLSYDSKMNIMRKAKEIGCDWHSDILNCSKSFRRMKIDIDFEEALKEFKEDDLSHFTIIKRDTYGENHIEICWNTMGLTNDYFIWLHLDLDNIPIVEGFIKEELGIKN